MLESPEIWKMSNRRFNSERQCERELGAFDFPYSMPSVRCCNEYREVKLLDLDLPRKFRSDPRLKRGVRTVTVEEFKELKGMIISELEEDATRLKDVIAPGVRFLPMEFTLPNEESDITFLYSDALIMSDDVLIDLQVEFPNEFKTRKVPDTPYNIAWPRNISQPPASRLPRVHCERCGNPNKRSRIVWDGEYERDSIPDKAHFFLIDTSLVIGVSNEFREFVLKKGYRNLEFLPLAIK